MFELQRRARALSSNSSLGNSNDGSPSNGRPGLSRAFANWDPSYASEKVDWYEEYIARHAPISMSWLERPVSHNRRESREIKGVGRYDRGDDSLIVAPLDDGALGIWDIGRQNNTTHTKFGKVITCSEPHLFSTYQNRLYGKLGTHYGPCSVECISVDQVRAKAYIAVMNEVKELDLETLKISSQTRYRLQISALSEVTYPAPLTVATVDSLHLHDPRERSGAGRSESSQHSSVECSTSVLSASSRDHGDFSKQSAREYFGRAAQLVETGPSSVVHLPSTSRQGDASDGYICVAGRFSNILTYSRRMFPHLTSTIHSGSRLASMASVPHPLLYPRLHPPSYLGAAHTLIACGEYRGKGSLEIYPFPTSRQSTPPSSFSSEHTPPTPILHHKNRTSASSSKLLSVTPHGTRIVFSDGDGGLKWVERDGHSLVRRWNINAYAASTTSPSVYHQSMGTHPSALFASSTNDGGNVARKIIPVGPWEDSRGELAVWTGERIGILGFRPKPRFEWEWDLGDEMKEGTEEALYAGRMRRALERQADEVRFVRGLGLRG